MLVVRQPGQAVEDVNLLRPYAGGLEAGRLEDEWDTFEAVIGDDVREGG